MIKLSLTAAAAADSRIHKTILSSRRPSNLAQQTTTSIISNEEKRDIMKTFKSLDNSGLSIKVSTQTIENERKRGEFIGMLLGTLGANLLGNMLEGKGFT